MIDYIAHNYEAYIRIMLSVGLGFVIGWDREFKYKPAGLKTYMYVCSASALITIVSINSVGELSTLFKNTMMDPMRLTAQIVSGLGFIGAGLIVKEGFKVKGLTSAAMIFFAGGVGIGIGAGFYSFVIFAVALSMTMAKIANHIENQRNQKLPAFQNANGKSMTDESLS